MAQRGITLHIPFSIVFDDTASNDDDAIRDLYRIFEEAEQAGFFDRTVIDPTYGEPVERIPFVPEPTDDELACHECGQPFSVDGNGIATHASDDSPDGIDHDADEDHVPFSLDEEDETFAEPCDRCGTPIPSNRDRSPNYCEPCAVIVTAQGGDED